jgi:starvation-inducible outer membrane lipoprotein
MMRLLTGLFVVLVGLLMLVGCVVAPRVIQREQINASGLREVQQCRQRVIRSEVISESCGPWTVK